MNLIGKAGKMSRKIQQELEKIRGEGLACRVHKNQGLRPVVAIPAPVEGSLHGVRG